MASSGNPLIENAAGKKDDDYADERHPVIVPLIGRHWRWGVLERFLLYRNYHG